MSKDCGIGEKSAINKIYTCFSKSLQHLNDGSQPKCSEQDLNEAIKTTPKLLIIHTNPTCHNCPPFMEVVNELFGTRPDVEYAELSERHQSCYDLSQKLNLVGTPTIIFFKNGKEAGRYAPIGKTEAQVKADLIKLVS